MIRVSVTIAAFAFVLSQVDVRQVGATLRGIPAGAVATAVFAVLTSVAFGSLRWRTLLRAYGASSPPGVLRLFRLYLIGTFYNSFVPGAVGGDLVRGIATREAFDGDPIKSGAGGVAVVFVGRACGLATLLALSSITLLAFPIEEFRWFQWVAWLALLGIAFGIVVLWRAAELGRRTSGRVSRWLSLVPALEHPASLSKALAWSFAGQLANVAAGHAIVSSLVPSVTLMESATLIPLISASAFFPLTVSGAGVRELAFASLYGLVGVPEVTAYAASLGYWASQLIVAVFGGALTFAGPLSVHRGRAS